MPSRRIEDLHPAARPKAEALIGQAKTELGLDIILTCTLRTEAEQLAYFAQGRKALTTVNELRADAGLPPITDEENRHYVTWVLTSIHEFGLAFDVAIMKPHSRLVEWSPKADFDDDGVPEYEELGLLGESLGLRWGGRFKGKDRVHFEYTGGLSLEELIAGKRPEGMPEGAERDRMSSPQEGDGAESGPRRHPIKPAICHEPAEED
jgi:peptidoglycan L-alanyl-D-glutamate endopeptidase CwlK